MFSHSFNDLSNRDTSEIKSFVFKLDRHDALLQFSIEGINFAHYLEQPINGNCYRYKVKSVNIEEKKFEVETVKY
ncbi:hypothetical protein [Allomuricauda sp. R78024]|uniref:hypothetical protein n=1 Tax=Allomuricauda sp. R78024 TaxID=3093867 RepID=UPI0037CBB5F8